MAGGRPRAAAAVGLRPLRGPVNADAAGARQRGPVARLLPYQLVRRPGRRPRCGHRGDDRVQLGQRGLDRPNAGQHAARQLGVLLVEVSGERLGQRRLDAGLLRVRWTLSRTSQGLQLDEPKTDKSRRTVPLPARRSRRSGPTGPATGGTAHRRRSLAGARASLHHRGRDTARAPQRAAALPDPRGVSRPPRRHPAHPPALRGELPAGGRNPHRGRPGTPGPLVVRDHGGHRQPRRPRPAARGRRPARPSVPLVTVAVPRAALLYALL